MLLVPIVSATPWNEKPAPSCSRKIANVSSGRSSLLRTRDRDVLNSIIVGIEINGFSDHWRLLRSRKVIMNLKIQAHHFMPGLPSSIASTCLLPHRLYGSSGGCSGNFANSSSSAFSSSAVRADAISYTRR